MNKAIAQSLGIKADDISNKKQKIQTDWIVHTVIIFISLLLFVFFGFVRIQGPSMEGSFHDGDLKVLWKQAPITRGSVIVLEEREEDGEKPIHIIKRLIGLGGDHIVYKDGNLFVNGELIKEPYVLDKNNKESYQSNWEITVPEHYVFVLGDNRDVSKDSRIVGSFKASAIRGRIYE